MNKRNVKAKKVSSGNVSLNFHYLSRKKIPFRFFFSKKKTLEKELKRIRILNRSKKKSFFEKESLFSSPLVSLNPSVEFSLGRLIKHWITFRVTQNNVFITALNEKGEVVAWQTAGMSGFRGPRRSTPYAAMVTGRKFGYRLQNWLKKTGDKKKGVVFGLILREGIRRKSKMLMRGFFHSISRTYRLRRRGRMPDFSLKAVIYRYRYSHNGIRKRKSRRI